MKSQMGNSIFSFSDKLAIVDTIADIAIKTKRNIQNGKDFLSENKYLK